jgi:hypothetical protein
LKVEFGLLICSAGMMPHWQVGLQCEALLMFDQPKGKVSSIFTKIMVPCNKHDWPPGVIDLCGPPW